MDSIANDFLNSIMAKKVSQISLQDELTNKNNEESKIISPNTDRASIQLDSKNLSEYNSHMLQEVRKSNISSNENKVSRMSNISQSIYDDIKEDDDLLSISQESTINIKRMNIEFDVKIMQTQIYQLNKEQLEYQKNQQDFDLIRQEIQILKEKISYAVMENSILYARLNKNEKQTDISYDKLLESKEQLMNKLIATEKEIQKYKDENNELESQLAKS